MAWLPISWTVPQYMDSNGDPYSGAVLKFYQDGTTTVTNMATSNTGGTQLTSVALNANGYPANGGSVFIPHIDQAYKVSLYPTQTAANANTGAIWTIDNLTPADLTDTDTDELTKVSSNDSTAGYLNGKLVAGSNVSLTEGSDGGNETLTIAALDSSTGLVLDESADHIATPAASKGEIWVKNDTPNRLYYTDDEENDFAISSLAQASNHTRAGNTQIWNGENDWGSALIVDASLVETTWESIGPTGSGADNIWGAMDVLPSNATILLVTVYMEAQKSSTGTVDAQLFITHGDDATPTAATDRSTLVLHRKSLDNAAETNGDAHTSEIMIPLGATNQDFQAYWSGNGDGQTITLYYKGFMTD